MSSTTYSSVVGDTFATIARKCYGVESYAPALRGANPSVMEPIAQGTVISVPPLIENAPSQTPSASPDEVALSIKGVRFRFWESIRISRRIDAPDAVSFAAPFEADAPGFREAFQFGAFHPLNVTIGGDRVFRGTMVTPTPVLEPESSRVQVDGYSTCAVLEDCTLPAGEPVEFKNLTLDKIAMRVCAPFGVFVAFAADPGAAFPEVTIERDERVWGFLTKLAQQRGILIASSSAGALRFYTPSADGEPVANFTQGASPLVSVTPEFNGQTLYSDVTGLAPTSAGSDGGSYTVKNPFAQGAVRPYTFRVSDANAASVKQATEAKAARMFAAAGRYSIAVDTWRNAKGNLWAPGQLVTLVAPDAMVYERYTFMVEAADLDSDAQSLSAVLSLVVPEAYTNQMPEALPWL